MIMNRNALVLMEDRVMAYFKRHAHMEWRSVRIVSPS